ncbi:MAG TPA: FAD-dependent oxidoreductase [Thermoanaerobaculia bacterium]|nr:FAD-dependent oxidoreductase [Thermoanaerobaculia bacterium]
MTTQTTPLWLATTNAPPRETLRGEIHADVVIIGAGITGLTAAVLLQERGKKVVVLEKERVAEGESGHTTAHLTEAVDARYHSIKRHFSKEAAKQVADASRAAIEQIEHFIKRYSIHCHFERVPGYLYTEKRKYVAELKNESLSAREAGCKAEWIEEGSVPLPFPTRGAVRFDNQAQFHPREYLLALAARVPLYEKTQVVKIAPGLVETEHGKVHAEEIIEATNVPIAGSTIVHTKQTAYRTYAMAFEVSGEHPQGLFWDTADPYHYTRWQTTDAGTYLIIGGEDHKVGHDEDSEAAFARLREYAVSLWGDLPLRYQWSGQIAEPHDGLPFIGKSGTHYISTGYSGQGMTFGTVGGMILADLITKRDNEWAKLFDPARIPKHGLRDFAAQNAEFPARVLADRLTSHDVESKDAFDVKAGEGKIIKLEGKKVAAYRDDAGTLHCVSPICTHMKCDVAWNTAERSWDCPCHGSRFGPDGHVLNGPAKVDLEKIEPR